MPRKSEARPVELGDRVVGAVDLPKIAVDQYIGTKTKIAQVTEHEGNFGDESYYIKVETDVIATAKRANGEDQPLRGSRIFGLVVVEAAR